LIRVGSALCLVALSASATWAGAADGPDAEARGWALRAYRAELLGDDEEVRRAWRWALRRDDDAVVHRAEALARIGDREAAQRGFRTGLDGPHGLRARAGLLTIGWDDPGLLAVVDRESPCRAWWFAPTVERARRCRALR
jgi:hypothetical protein